MFAKMRFSFYLVRKYDALKAVAKEQIKMSVVRKCYYVLTYNTILYICIHNIYCYGCFQNEYIAVYYSKYYHSSKHAFIRKQPMPARKIKRVEEDPNDKDDEMWNYYDVCKHYWIMDG